MTIERKTKGFKAIIFDLDGTLLDTLLDLANATNSALVRLGFEPHPADSYRHFVGEGTEMLIRRVLPKKHLDEQTVKKCLSIMQNEYRIHWADNTRPYDGIGELLKAVEHRGLYRAVLSNKPDEFTRLAVAGLLAGFSFDIVRGMSSELRAKPDPAAALQIAAELKVPPSEVLYLGDTDTDMQTANAAGMYPVGALWGFRSKEELVKNGAKALAARPQDVVGLLDEAVYPSQ